MVYETQFLTTSEEATFLYDFIKSFSLDHPNYLRWLEKCKIELGLGHKKAFYTTVNGKIAGSIIFQMHKKDRSILKLKNLKVGPEFEKMGVGSKLESLGELYAKENGFKRIQCDAHSDNPVIQFMVKRGYHIETFENLYTPTIKETILSKEI